VEVVLISGTSDLSTFAPFSPAFFIFFCSFAVFFCSLIIFLFSFFIFLAILDFLPILRIPSDSEHHNHRFTAWGDSFLTAELLSPPELP
jgi:hypothetical protein